MIEPSHGHLDLGDFAVLACCPREADRMQERLHSLRLADRPGEAPAVHRLGPGVLAASWGSVTLRSSPETGLIGVLQAPNATDYAALCSELVRAEERSGLELAERLAGVPGNFAAVTIAANDNRITGITDAFRRIPLYRSENALPAILATNAQLVAAMNRTPAEISLHSLYHYLNFSYVPAPHCIYAGVSKVPAGHVVRCGSTGWRDDSYWRPRFAEDYRGARRMLEAEFREALFDTVRRYRPRNGTRWGTFLSGGTDSSSITGILARESAPTPVHSFSIGFEEPGYDELEYARLAARHYGVRSHVRRVSEADTVQLIPELARLFDEPYGNASAIPTTVCARSAAEQGVAAMIAGDGGDENFGGNERYAKDAIYRRYALLPGWVRRGLARPKALDGADNGRFQARISNFLRRGALPNPDRFYSDDSFASDYFQQLLADATRGQLDRDASLRLVRDTFDDADASSELHRLMYIDLMMTIADNDITKVHRAGRTAGVAVLYPYLDPQLVQFAGRLAAKWKVHGTQKRYLFKRALGEFLPAEILRKPKQGFALPIADWMRRPGDFQSLAFDTLGSRRFRERGIFESGFVERLMQAHQKGSWDYSPELWRLLMLELWQRENLDAR